MSLIARLVVAIVLSWTPLSFAFDPLPVVKAGQSIDSSESRINTNELTRINRLDKIPVSAFKSLSEAVAVLGVRKATTLLVNTPTIITRDTVIPANISLRVTATGLVTGHHKLTIYGPVSIGLSRAFDGPDVRLFSSLENGVYPEWWGAKGAGDDTAALRAAIASINTLPANKGAQGVIKLSRLYNISGPLQIPSSIRVAGNGINFSAGFNISDDFHGSDFAILINGTSHDGGYAFRNQLENFTINHANAPPSISSILIQDAYTVSLRNLFIVYAKSRGIVIMPSKTAVNDVIIDNVHIYGINGLTADYGIWASNVNGLRIDNCDVEVFKKGGIAIFGSTTANITGLYAERNLVAIMQQNNLRGSVVINGGTISTPNNSAIGLQIMGPNLTVIGGTYLNQNNSVQAVTTNYAPRKPLNVHIIGATVSGNSDTIYDPKNWVTTYLRPDYKTPSAGLSWQTTRDVPNVKPTVLSSKTVDLYKIFGGNNCIGYVDIDITAQSPPQPATVYTARYRIGFGASSGSINVSDVTEYGKATINGSSSLELTVTAIVSGPSEIIIRVTPRLRGNVSTVNIHCSATMGQSSSDGATYITAL